MPGSPNPEISSAAGRVASLSRKRTPENAQQLDDARRDLREAQLAAHIRKVVASAPPLTDDQRSRLAELLAPVRVTGGEAQ